MFTKGTIKRNLLPLFLLITLFSLLFLWFGCLGGSPKIKDAGDEIKLPAHEFKRGILKGPQYFNEYYRFQMTTPRGWKATRPRSEYLVKLSSNKGNAKIEVTVREYAKLPEFNKAIEGLSNDKNLKLNSQNREVFLDYPALVCDLKVNESNLKKHAIFVLKGYFLYQFYFSSSKEQYQNNEKIFKKIMDSVRFTSKFIEGVGQEDYFTYFVKSDDTLKRLANRFLNNPAEASTIAYFNQISILIPQRPIDIPRYIVYTVMKGDTKNSIAKKMYNDSNRFQLIKNYNPDFSEDNILKPGNTIKIPMYFNYLAKPGDTYMGLAQKYLHSADRSDLIFIYNGKKQLQANNSIKIPILWRLRGFIVYKVRPNDSLASIAKAFTGDSKKYLVIADFNNIRAPFELSIGQSLKIPKDIIKTVPKFKKKRKVKKKTEEDKIEEEIEGPIYEPE